MATIALSKKEITMKLLGELFTETSRMHRRFHQSTFESFGIYRGQPELFFTLYKEKGPINQTGLAQKLKMAPSTLTRMVQSLERKGYIARRTDKNNQRQILISLTPEGRIIHDKLKKRLTEADQRIFRDFNKEEQEQLRKLLLRIQDGLHSEEKAKGENK
jgi:DNA-binding MarR family transcriptional regulator